MSKSNFGFFRFIETKRLDIDFTNENYNNFKFHRGSFFGEKKKKFFVNKVL